MKHLFNTILIFLLLCFFMPASGQQSGNIVVGKVYSQEDGALIGVSVKEVDGTNRVVNGTMTDVNGNFSLRIKSPSNKLVFSYISFKERTVRIGDTRNFSIEMQDDDKELKAVEIVAKKMSNTGTMSIPEREVPMAMQTIQADFEQLGVASLDEALQGQIAGLDIVSNSGDVGSGSAMRLRGTSSINANVTPLIVVNDVIFAAENTDVFDFVNADQQSFANLLSINVDDIESITVMKDGASTAIYGSQGANGVISIRTKKGRRGKPIVQYNYRLSGQWQPEGLRMLNGDEYTMFLKEAYFNPNHSDQSSDIKELSYITNDREFPYWRMFNNNTDWVKAVQTTGITHDHYMTVSGGGEKATFYVSGGYYNQKGSIIGQGLNRFTSRMELQYFVSDRIRFNTEMSFTYTDQENNYIYDKQTLLSIAYKKMPNMSIYNEVEDGVSTNEYFVNPITMSDKLSDQRDKLINPVALADLADNDSKSFLLRPTFRLIYDILPVVNYPVLRLNASVTFDINNSNSYSYLPQELFDLAWNDEKFNSVSYGTSKNFKSYTDINVNYRPIFGNTDHMLQVYAGGQIQSGNAQSQSESSFLLPSGITSPGAGSYVSSLGSNASEWRTLAFTASSHYSYKSKYNLGLSVRLQGSSKFGEKGNNSKLMSELGLGRFGTFYGVSARWNIIDENFMEPTRDWLSMLAIRLSHGLNGNEPSENYLYYSRYESWSNYLGESTLRPIKVRLDNLRWETVRDYNVGTNLGFWDEKFTIAFNYYYKITEDLLNTSIGIPTTSGFSSYAVRNVGTLENQGWELNFNFNKFIKVGKFYVDYYLNFSNVKNMLLAMDADVLDGYNSSFSYKNGDYLQRLQLNNSLGSIYGFRYKGVYEYSIDNADLIESGYTQGTAPIARDANGNIIYDAKGNPVQMKLGYKDDGTSEWNFQGGDAIYEDINHDGNINELDIVYLGNSNPKFNGGMGFKFVYDRLSVGINSTFRYGNKIINLARMNAENMYENNNQSVAVRWRWRKEGDPNHMLPRALYKSGYNFLASDRYVEDGSFVRIQNVSLSYMLPDKLMQKYNFRNVNLFVTFYNLYVFTKYTGADPEVGYSVLNLTKDSSQTPRPQSFIAGFSLRF